MKQLWIREHGSLLERAHSMWEMPIKFSMVANPHPNLQIAFSKGHSPVVQRYAHHPGARIKTQSFQVQTGMGWVLSEFLVGQAGSSFYGSR
jgi:hypothetical protein